MRLCRRPSAEPLYISSLTLGIEASHNHCLSLMRMVDLIRDKREGRGLSAAEIEWIVRAYMSGEAADYQLSAWLMAVYFRGLDAGETRALTHAMLHSGRVLGWSGDRPVADKHSTGGVGDKTSLILAPLAACCGVRVPMISGRGLGHTGGTLDKLESIPGFRVRLELREFEQVLERHGCAMIGQTEEIAPADRRLYALRDVTATVESRPLITASILSKKLAEGLDALVLDVKTGDGAFMTALEPARELARMMQEIGGEMGLAIEALITDMDQPLGRAVGNALEVEECLEVLRGSGPEDLRELTLELTARMVRLARRARGQSCELAAAREECRGYLDGGAALERFCAMAETQGGQTRALREAGRLPQARHEAVIRAPRAGYIQAAAARGLGLAAMHLGAGRARVEDSIDAAAGLRMHVRRGDPVSAGDALCILYYNDASRLENARTLAQNAFTIGETPAAPRSLIQEILPHHPAA